ncbi:Platinum sensitivity protein [Mortierella hygrophila]|uniref:Platinum sensitivity protein n=1 Tax=Mortierella hygrophila TaxID=979708 RepID=A0A9P6K5F6_9FUNG|nr:Platinum sensitivity protein [Mortierella hygrophila]
MTATSLSPTLPRRIRAMDADDDLPESYEQDMSYIANLVHHLIACEQAGLTSSLHTLRSILLQLTPRQSLRKIWNENFVGCIGILEYDPNLTKKSPYRRVFKTRSNAKQVVPFSNPRINLWIQAVLRLTFLQESVLLHCANCTVDSTLAVLVRTNERNVVNEIVNEDRAFLTEVFKTAQDPAEPQRCRNDTVKFVYQLFTMGDRISTSACSTLPEASLFQMLEYSFAAPDPRISTLGVKILVMAAEERTKLVRSRILDETVANGQCALFDTIIDKAIQEENANSNDRLAEVISKLLDVGHKNSDRDYPVFLGMFYSEAKLTPLVSGDNEEFMRGLLSSQDKSLRLASLRPFRTCLVAEDYDYDTLLIDNSVTYSVFGLLETQGSKGLGDFECSPIFRTILDEYDELLDEASEPYPDAPLSEYDDTDETPEPSSEGQRDCEVPYVARKVDEDSLLISQDSLVVPKGRREPSTDTEMPTASSRPLRRKLKHTDFDSDETSSEYSNRFSTAKGTELDFLVTYDQRDGKRALVGTTYEYGPDSSSAGSSRREIAIPFFATRVVSVAPRRRTTRDSSGAITTLPPDLEHIILDIPSLATFPSVPDRVKFNDVVALSATFTFASDQSRWKQDLG